MVTLTTFSFFYFLIHQGWGSDYVRTFIFLLLSLNSLIYIFSIRSFRKAIWEYNPFENNILNITVLIAAIWLFIGIYVPPFSTILQTVPLGVGEWVVAAIISFVDLAAIEVVKKLVFREDSSR